LSLSIQCKELEVTEQEKLKTIAVRKLELANFRIVELENLERNSRTLVENARLRELETKAASIDGVSKKDMKNTSSSLRYRVASAADEQLAERDTIVDWAKRYEGGTVTNIFTACSGMKSYHQKASDATDADRKNSEE